MIADRGRPRPQALRMEDHYRILKAPFPSFAAADGDVRTPVRGRPRPQPAATSQAGRRSDSLRFRFDPGPGLFLQNVQWQGARTQYDLVERLKIELFPQLAPGEGPEFLDL